MQFNLQNICVHTCTVPYFSQDNRQTHMQNNVVTPPSETRLRFSIRNVVKRIMDGWKHLDTYRGGEKYDPRLREPASWFTQPGTHLFGHFVRVQGNKSEPEPLPPPLRRRPSRRLRLRPRQRRLPTRPRNPLPNLRDLLCSSKLGRQCHFVTKMHLKIALQTLAVSSPIP